METKTHGNSFKVANMSEIRLSDGFHWGFHSNWLPSTIFKIFLKALYDIALDYQVNEKKCILDNDPRLFWVHRNTVRPSLYLTVDISIMHFLIDL